MSSTTYLIFFTILCQLNILALSGNEGFNNVITQVGNSSNVNPNPNYQNNVESLLSKLISQSSQGFFNTSVGDVPDRAYGFYLCRGDLSAYQCNDCLENIRRYMLDLPLSNYFYDGLVYNMHLECMVHYANSSTPLVYRQNTTTFSRSFGDALASHQQYDTMLLQTIEQLIVEAKNGTWTTKANFETVTSLFGHQIMYVLFQCTPDLSAMNCSNCLSNLYSNFTPTTVGGTVISANCLLKYNDESFIGSGYRSFMPSYFHATLVLFFTVGLILM